MGRICSFFSFVYPGKYICGWWSGYSCTPAHFCFVIVTEYQLQLLYRDTIWSYAMFDGIEDTFENLSREIFYSFCFLHTVAPMRGRGFGRGMINNNRHDPFRSRPPNTSRPPSMHVDDFVKMENQQHGPNTQGGAPQGGRRQDKVGSWLVPHVNTACTKCSIKLIYNLTRLCLNGLFHVLISWMLPWEIYQVLI